MSSQSVHRAKPISILVGLALWHVSIGGYGGDEYVVATWGVEQGLPQNSILSMLRTRDGYLWMGTFNGLARFDGLQFVTFNTANTSALRSEEVVSLFQDSKDRLWVGTSFGLVRHVQGRFESISEAAGLHDAYVTGIRQLPAGTIVVASDQGVFRQTGDVFVPIPVPDSSWPTRHSLIEVDAAGRLWVAHRSDVYLWTEGTLQRRATLPGPVTFLLGDQEGLLWCGLKTGALFRMSGESWTEEGWLRRLPSSPAPLPAGTGGGLMVPKTVGLALGFSLNWFTQTRNGDRWIATDQGVFRRRGESVLPLSIEQGLPTGRILQVLGDDEGNVWLGTSEHGLVRLSEKAVETYCQRDGLSSPDAITVLETPDRRVWLGTFDGGLKVQVDGRWQRLWPMETSPPFPSVISLCLARDGALWVGTHSHGVYRWSEGKMERRTDPKEEIARVIFEDRDGGLWLGTSKFGVKHLLGQTEEWYHRDNGLSLNLVTAIAQDRPGDIWVGTEYGLNRIAAGKVTRFYREDGLGANLVNVLHVDSDGVLWIGTMGGGLARYREGRFAALNSSQGLPHDGVTQIVEDDAGNLWLGSQRGIFRLKKEQVHAVLDGQSRFVETQVYAKAEGLLNLSFVGGFQPTSMKSRDGRLWFCSPSGVVIIDSRRLPGRETPLPVYVEQVWVDGENLVHASRACPPSRTDRTRCELPKPEGPTRTEVNSDRMLVVAPGARRLEFHYTALSFSAPEQVQFTCKLEGYDEDWQFMGTRRVAYYTRVPPGRYQFRVRAALGERNAAPTDAALAFVVQPFLHETAWFRATALCSVLGLAFGLFRWWTRELTRRRVERDNFTRRLMQAHEQERKRIAAELHDGLGQSLLVIANRSKIGLREGAPPELAYEQLRHISSLSAQAVEDVRTITKNLRPYQLDRLGLTRALQALLRDGSASPSLGIVEEIDPLDRLFPPETEIHLFRITQEILNNVIKHSQASEARFTIRREAGQVRFVFSDNGRGFDFAAERKSPRGSGLEGIVERLRILGASWAFHAQAGQGTRLEFTLTTKGTPDGEDSVCPATQQHPQPASLRCHC